MAPEASARTSGGRPVGRGDTGKAGSLQKTYNKWGFKYISLIIINIQII